MSDQSQKGILAKVSDAINHAGINIKPVITSQIVINLLLSSSDIYKACNTIEALELPAITELVAIEDVSIIAAVGEGILEQKPLDSNPGIQYVTSLRLSHSLLMALLPGLKSRIQYASSLRLFHGLKQDTICVEPTALTRIQYENMYRTSGFKCFQT